MTAADYDNNPARDESLADGEPVGCRTREELMAHLKELDKPLSVEELKEILA